MMKKFIVGLLILTGCTSSHYVQSPGNTASQEQLDSDLDICKKSAFKKYNDAHANDDHSGAVVGGVLLGPLGAIAGNAAGNSSNQSPKVDINVEIDNCMTKKDYSGASTGYN